MSGVARFLVPSAPRWAATRGGSLWRSSLPTSSREATRFSSLPRASAQRRGLSTEASGGLDPRLIRAVAGPQRTRVGKGLLTAQSLSRLPGSEGGAVKAAEAATSAAAREGGGSVGGTIAWTVGLGGLLLGAGFVYATDYQGYGTRAQKEIMEVTQKLPGLGHLYEYFDEGREDMKLLPDFPELPPGSREPRTLVLDLEDTLIHMEWSQQYGWRAVKRPNVDTFLLRAALAGYEIVLFTTGVMYFVEPAALNVDARLVVSHRLYRDHCTYDKESQQWVKEVLKLNRDPKNIICVDDQPASFVPSEPHVIPVKPFVDKNDVDDAALLELLPVLESFTLKDVEDVREEILRLKKIGDGDPVRGFYHERDSTASAVKKEQAGSLGGVVRGRANPLGKANVDKQLKERIAHL